MSGDPRRFFISYAHEDASLLAKFVEGLEKAGHHVFFDKRMKLGSTWADELERELNACDFFLLLLSESALASEMVMQEVERVRNRRRTGSAPLILTVRVKMDGPLPFRWAAYLDAYQHRVWRDDADFAPILRAIAEVAGTGQEDAPRAPPPRCYQGGGLQPPVAQGGPPRRGGTRRRHGHEGSTLRRAERGRGGDRIRRASR